MREVPPAEKSGAGALRCPPPNRRSRQAADGLGETRATRVAEGCEVESGSGEEAVEEARAVLHPPEPGLHQRGQLADVAFSQVGQGSLQVLPHRFDWVELVRVRREPDDGQPVPGADQVGHHVADVGVQAVPHDHERPAELLVRVVQQPGVLGFGEPLAPVIAGTAAVVHPVDQPGPLPPFYYRPFHLPPPGDHRLIPLGRPPGRRPAPPPAHRAGPG